MKNVNEKCIKMNFIYIYLYKIKNATTPNSCKQGILFFK